ncbi:unnamed protein product [Didymodactylos carnosus]|uniref:Uncharacterized protein n=1 Tax=Didymodactylos carnosus TaxID=1234261 RepID=A0A8S2TWG1_9BILA|nr:unnamed protein product [Didymodactylos carnosus]
MSSKSCNSFITNDLIQNIQNRFNKKTSRPPPSSSSTVRTYSLHDIKSRINYFENKLTDELHSLTTTTNLSNADKGTNQRVTNLNIARFLIFKENSETTATITVKKRLKSLECKQTPETLQNVLVNTLANTCLKESYGNALSRTMNSIASSRNNHSLSTSRLNKMIMNRTRTLSYDGAYSGGGGGGGGGRKQLSNSLSELSALSKDDIERTSDTFVSNVDLENTYFYPYTEYDDGATSKLYDDSQQTTNDLYSGAVSLTTITSDHPSNSTLATSNSEKFCKQHQYKQSDENTCLEYSDGDFEQELLYQSDMDDISETTTTISAAAANNCSHL